MTAVRRLAFALAVAALAAGVTWWFTRSQPRPSGSADAGPGDGPEGASEVPLLAAKGGSAGRGSSTDPRRPTDGIPRRRVEGRIEGPAGAPLDCTVALWGEGRDQDGKGYLARLPAEPGWVHGDARGRFSCDVLFLGDEAPLWATASPRDPRWAAEPVRQAKAGDALVLHLVEAAPVRVTVRGPDGAPILGASVSAWFPARENRWSMPVTDADFAGALRFEDALGGGSVTGADGIARLPKADLAGLTLHVSGPSVRASSSWLPYEQENWVCTDTVVVLEPALRLEGRVEDPQGKPVTEGEVEYRVRGKPDRVRVEYDGTFDIQRIPPGPVVLRYLDESAPATADSPETTAEAGASDVVVRATFGAELLVRMQGWPREAGGTAILTPEAGTGAPPKAAEAEVSIDGTVRFRGLVAAATYVLWVPPSVPGLLRPPPSPTVERGDEPPKTPPEDPRESLVAWGVYRAGIKPSGEPLDVPLAPGRTVVAQVALPTIAPGRKTAHGDDGPLWSGKGRIQERGLALEAFVDKAGRLLLRGVPPGAWTLSVHMDCEVRATDNEWDFVTTWWAGEGTIDAEGQVPTIGLRSIPVREDGDWWAR